MWWYGQSRENTVKVQDQASSAMGRGGGEGGAGKKKGGREKRGLRLECAPSSTLQTEKEFGLCLWLVSCQMAPAAHTGHVLPAARCQSLAMKHRL